MNLFESILSMFGTIAPMIGSAFGPIGGIAGTIAGSLAGPIVNLIQATSTGTSKASDYLAALGILQAAVSVLKAQTNLSPAMLSEIAAVEADLAAAFKAYISAEGGFNPALYAPIAQVS